MSASPTPALDTAAPAAGPPDVGPVLRAGLEEAARRLADDDVPTPEWKGKLLRPLVAYALVPPYRRGDLDPTFWMGACAVQMVHEASLLHDDILDHAMERRGVHTLVARHGVGPAVVAGDQLLTAAYRAALAVERGPFLQVFIRAVERTVAGEVAQGRLAGRRVTPETYARIVDGKSGELFGAAAALGGAVLGEADLARRVSAGRALGALYQRVDDLLDYCALADTGKPALQDYRQGKWTWVLDLAGVDDFSLSDDAVLDLLFTGASDGASPARRALDHLLDERERVLASARDLAPGDDLLVGVLDGWVDAAVRGVSLQEGAHAAPAPPSVHVLTPREPTMDRSEPSPDDARSLVVERARALGGPDQWSAYFGRHARTFRFAARLFPAADARSVAGVYAFCRFSDDLVDHPHDGAGPEVVGARLDQWRALTRAAWSGETTDVPVLDRVLGQARRAGVAWRYPDAVLDGVGMDLDTRRYADWNALETYTFGVAGAVGGWITQLLGIHDPDLLERAHALGHGMQLTNIARDVGEDWRMGRLYLPATLLDRHDVTEMELAAMAAGQAPPSPGYRAVMEELLDRADAYYETAWPGIRALPPGFRRPVAVAASAYRGIHREIRRNDFDNLTRRAHTSLPRKLVLGAAGLLRSRR